MYFYMSLCSITFLTSVKLRQGFASKFVWVFLGWTPIKVSKNRGASPIFRGVLSILKKCPL